MTTQPPAFRPDFDNVRTEHPALADLSDAEIVEFVLDLNSTLIATITEFRAQIRQMNEEGKAA